MTAGFAADPHSRSNYCFPASCKQCSRFANFSRCTDNHPTSRNFTVVLGSRRVSRYSSHYSTLRHLDSFAAHLQAEEFTIQADFSIFQTLDRVEISPFPTRCFGLLSIMLLPSHVLSS